MVPTLPNMDPVGYEKRPPASAVITSQAQKHKCSVEDVFSQSAGQWQWGTTSPPSVRRLAHLHIV